MLFGKKKSIDPRRTRQPAQPARPAQPVFSYHAQSARTEQATGRRTTKLLWTSPIKPSPRRDPRYWPKRVLMVSLAILVVALFINSLFLGREPKIVTVGGTGGGSQLLLRSQGDYYQAARAALTSSFANFTKITVNTTRLARVMEAQFPELQQVSVTLPIIGRQPIFYIQPARPAVLLKGADGIFALDSTGRVMMRATDIPRIEKLGLLVVEDQSGLPVIMGRSALPSDNIAFITEVQGQMKARNLKIVDMVLPAGTSELDVRLDGAPYTIKYNLRGDARAEVGTFLAVKQHLEREGKTPSLYIDVRVDNRAYYK